MNRVVEILLTIARIIFLGGIVFFTTTNIPQQTLAIQTRIAVSVIVVILYFFLEYVFRGLGFIRFILCKLLCSCNATNPFSRWTDSVSTVPSVSTAQTSSSVGNVKLDDATLERLRQELLAQTP
jgi:hypothetical protein